MKRVEIKSSIGSDRLATWNEVRCAMSLSSQGALELVGTGDYFHETDSDFNNRACNLPEDAMWLAIVNEMLDSKTN